MGLISWLKARLFRRAAAAATRSREEDFKRRRGEVSEFLVGLSRELSLDGNMRKYLTFYILMMHRRIGEGKSILFGPDVTLDQLAAEAAYQGFLDPVRYEKASGTNLREDLLMRMLVHYAEKGNARSAEGVRRFAAGAFNKRSQTMGTEEALRIAKNFVATHSQG